MCLLSERMLISSREPLDTTLTLNGTNAEHRNKFVHACAVLSSLVSKLRQQGAL
jgi:hypothetical protein